MSAPLEFLKIFAGQLRSAGIPFAITSGMACVHYGLQQNTKDSDWIIPADALERLRELLAKLEGELPPWRVSYRQIFGAPLDAEYMQHGWTSHLTVWDNAASVEHKVDIFSKPPRVQAHEIEADSDGWVTRHVVAQMKRTDRDKDWPILHGLGQQLWERNNPLGLLHLTRPDALTTAWQTCPDEVRSPLAARRPLLRVLDAAPPPPRPQLERWLLLERMVWERVNQARYDRFTRAWKRFHRQWRGDEDWDWPNAEPFWLQHRYLADAVRRHQLPPDPLAGLRPEQLVAAALEEVATVAHATRNEIDQVLPPVEELLP
ncbi:MAG: hypothetical protein HS113_16220 [Verrucomicrobiales bacterium]|nr:hypothetical protein [Verrucomicrobiales bacterium]